METGRQDGGSDKNHAPFSVGKTGNISRKFLTIILKIFDKNFERLQDALYVFAIYKRFCSPRFRIAAPSATQRTPFKKYVCSDTRSVMYGISLNIKYICFHCFIHLLFPLGFLQIHLCTRNNVFLQFLVQGCKQCIVACYPYHQILIILRVLLCIPQCLIRNYIILGVPTVKISCCL